MLILITDSWIYLPDKIIPTYPVHGKWRMVSWFLLPPNIDNLSFWLLEPSSKWQFMKLSSTPIPAFAATRVHKHIQNCNTGIRRLIHTLFFQVQKWEAKVNPKSQNMEEQVQKSSDSLLSASTKSIIYIFRYYCYLILFLHRHIYTLYHKPWRYKSFYLCYLIPWLPIV